MRFLALNSQALLALSLVLGSQALPRKSNVPTLKRADKKYDSTTNCAIYNNKNAKEIWDDSLAGEIADDFINEHGVSNWVQKLDQEIFNEQPNHLDCFDVGPTCNLGGEKCQDYADKGYEGAWYLYSSLVTARGFFDALHKKIQDNAIREALDISQIGADFKKDDSDAKPNIPVLVAASFGILSGGLGAAASAGAGIATGVASGAAGAAGGLSTLMGNANPKDEEDKFEARLAARVQSTFEESSNKIRDITYALYGKEGYDQKLIPKEMTRQSFDNTVVNALADGQWLTGHPTDDLDKNMETVYTYLKQSMAMMMIRYTRKGFWFVDSDVEKKKCGDGDGDHGEEFWHDEAEGCVKLMEVTNRNELLGRVDLDYTPMDIQDKLWGNGDRYDLDVKKSFQNAYDCWVDNDGEVGETKPNDDLSDQSIPKCWFGLHIVRGAKTTTDDISLDYIKMDDFPGHTKDKRWHGRFDKGKLSFD